jgi:hypothetical protein
LLGQAKALVDIKQEVFTLMAILCMDICLDNILKIAMDFDLLLNPILNQLV